jgi:putative spermidine/putrescine transport system permease protein
MSETPDRLSGAARLALLAPAGLLVAALLTVPLGLLLSYSLAPGGSTRADFSAGLTLENYVDILGDAFYLAIIFKTLWLSLIITAASIAIGWPLAYFLWKAPRRFKTLLAVAVVAPLLISIPVRNYGWMVILGDTGVVNKALIALGLIRQPLRMMFTDFAIVLGLTHVLMPFVVLSVLATLERIPDNLAEAAQSLGANRLRAICAVVVPLSMPGVLAGGTLVFCVAISAYVTPALMGPSGAKYSATLVYQQFVSTFDWPRGAAIAAVLLAITVAALAIVLGGVKRRYRHLLRSN